MAGKVTAGLVESDSSRIMASVACGLIVSSITAFTLPSPFNQLYQCTDDYESLDTRDVF